MRIWTAHGARFVTRSTAADWRPVFEQALLLEWRKQVDWALETLAIDVSGWDSDAAVLRETELFQRFETRSWLSSVVVHPQSARWRF